VSGVAIVFRAHLRRRAEKVMAAQISASSSPAGLAASAAAPDELESDIKKTKEKIEKLETEIDTIRKGDDDTAKEQGYSTRIAALEALRAKEIELLKVLAAYENQKLTLQQQQSGAGASMLLVCRTPFCKAVITYAASVYEHVQPGRCKQLFIVYA
jgi:predicted RNase H-like nuclease (RuvC/YqgF family)